MSKELPYDERLIKSYLSISSNPQVTKELLNEKSVNNIAEFFGYAGYIKSHIPKIGENSGFLNYLDQIRTFPAQVALRVLTTPAAYHWNSMTRLLLNAAVSNEHSADLNHYLDFLGLSLAEGLKAHLNDFGRFTVSVHILAKTNFESAVPVTIRLPNTFPGTNLALLRLEGHEDFQHSVELSSLQSSVVEQFYKLPQLEPTESIPIQFDNNESVLFQRMPSRKGNSGDIVIDSFDPCLNLLYVENYPRIKTYERTQIFLDTLNQAFRCLTSYRTELVSELELITSSITLMDTTDSGAEMCSGTSSAIFGGYFLSETNNPLYLAEMLLHEFSHNKLRLLEEVCPLFLPDSPNLPRFYSPWRDDPRPLNGIQHGLYVFSAIAYFWLRVYFNSESPEERSLAQRRVATLQLQLNSAEEEFSEHAKLTEQGRIFLDEIRQRIQFLEKSISSWQLPELLPLFSGVVRDNNLKKIPVTDAIRKHRWNWEQNYRSRKAKTL